MSWHYRQFSRDEAAALSGVRHLDMVINRNRHISTLFSEKRGSRRWFSLKDICVLRVAFELERAGRNWLTAIGTAFDHLEHPPPEDALLIAPAVIRRACGLPRIISDRDVPRLPFDVSTIVIPIGRIVADIIKESANVAV